MLFVIFPPKNYRWRRAYYSGKSKRNEWFHKLCNTQQSTSVWNPSPLCNCSVSFKAYLWISLQQVKWAVTLVEKKNIKEVWLTCCSQILLYFFTVVLQFGWLFVYFNFRISTDLLLWSPAAPKPKGAVPTVVQDLSSFPHFSTYPGFSMCKSGIQYGMFKLNLS